jgi:hypothetical protein
MPFDPARDPDALTIDRAWRASPEARAEVDANLRMLRQAAIYPGRQVSPELRLIAVIREAVAGSRQE